MENKTIILLNKFDKNIKILDFSNENIYGILDLKKFHKLIKLYCNFSKNIRIINVPKSLKYLLAYSFTKIINYLPNLITHLIFSANFNQSVNNLPNSITHLTFGFSFNKKIDNLPNSISHLTFGCMFNKKVNNLPYSIKYLTFGENFNQSVNNLPNSITHLTFNCIIDKQKINKFPVSLKKIYFCN